MLSIFDVQFFREMMNQRDPKQNNFSLSHIRVNLLNGREETEGGKGERESAHNSRILGAE